MDAINIEKSTPAGLDSPAYIPIWMGLAEGGDRGQGMENIAHRAQTHNQDARLLMVQ
jgi:hypothetical protein